MSQNTSSAEEGYELIKNNKSLMGMISDGDRDAFEILFKKLQFGQKYNAHEVYYCGRQIVKDQENLSNKYNIYQNQELKKFIRSQLEPIKEGQELIKEGQALMQKQVNYLRESLLNVSYGNPMQSTPWDMVSRISALSLRKASQLESTSNFYGVKGDRCMVCNCKGNKDNIVHGAHLLPLSSPDVVKGVDKTKSRNTLILCEKCAGFFDRGYYTILPSNPLNSKAPLVVWILDEKFHHQNNYLEYKLIRRNISKKVNGKTNEIYRRLFDPENVSKNKSYFEQLKEFNALKNKNENSKHINSKDDNKDDDDFKPYFFPIIRYCIDENKLSNRPYQRVLATHAMTYVNRAYTTGKITKEHPLKQSLEVWQDMVNASLPDDDDDNNNNTNFQFSDDNIQFSDDNFQFSDDIQLSDN